MSVQGAGAKPAAGAPRAYGEQSWKNVPAGDWWKPLAEGKNDPAARTALKMALLAAHADPKLDTTAQLAAFQKQSNLSPANGVMTADTARKLNANLTLPGDKSPAAADIQQRLVSLGYKDAATDMLGALKRFQADQGMKQPDGIVGQNTRLWLAKAESNHWKAPAASVGWGSKPGGFVSTFKLGDVIAKPQFNVAMVKPGDSVSFELPKKVADGLLHGTDGLGFYTRKAGQGQDQGIKQPPGLTVKPGPNGKSIVSFQVPKEWQGQTPTDIKIRFNDDARYMAGMTQTPIPPLNVALRTQ